MNLSRFASKLSLKNSSPRLTTAVVAPFAGSSRFVTTRSSHSLASPNQPLRRRRILLGATATLILVSSYSTSTQVSAASATDNKDDEMASDLPMLNYETMANANVQPLDMSSSTNPAPEGANVKLSDYMCPNGGVIYLVRRPGASSDSAAIAASPHILALFKENLDSQIREFLPSVPRGRFLLHSDTQLYKVLRKTPVKVLDLFSWSLVKKFRALEKTVGGNMKGEGMVKGAMIVYGTKEQGIIHVEYEEFGKDPDVGRLDAAIQQIKGAKTADAKL